jgi:1-acylglycerol-3-phosphate O-acyltransferase
MWRALASPQTIPPPGAKLVPLSAILQKYPDSVIVVLPECTTSNGRGILSLAPSILTAPSRTRIYPVNLRYSPADITTPLPSAYISFLWDLCSRPTHCIRVRIAEAIQSSSTGLPSKGTAETFSISKSEEDSLLDPSFSSAETLTEEGKDGLSTEERKVLDRVADDLARLGRSKRVGLGVKEKVEFIKVWTKTRTIW